MPLSTKEIATIRKKATYFGAEGWGTRQDGL